MTTKSEILQEGVSNAEHSYHKEGVLVDPPIIHTEPKREFELKPIKKEYHRCPFCQSVNLKILIEDKDAIHFVCLECGKQDWKTKL